MCRVAPPPTSMDDTDQLDYEAEVHRFHNKLQTNQNFLQRTLSTYKMEVSARFQHHRAVITSIKDKLERAEKRVEELREQIKQREVESSQAREDAKRMIQELEKANLALRGKKEEVEQQKEILADCMEKLKEKEQWAMETRQRNQGKVSLAESSVELFQTHLGLEIICTHHDTFVFKFTQVSRTNPDAEYLLEVNLEGDTYHLLNSEPPLPCLPKLQDALAASGNLTACLAHVRKLFQRADSKRPMK